MIYLYIFIISSFFIYLAEHIHKEHTKIKYVCFCLAIIVPSFFAAIRDKYCGIDVTFYVTPTYDSAKSYNSISSFMNNTEIEYGYGIFVYYITKLFGDLFYVHFFTQIVIISPFILLLTTLKKEYEINIYIAYFIYLLLCYNTSLCIIRQNIASSISILSIVFLIRKKYLLFLLFGVSACFVHNSNILFIIPTVLLYLFRDKVSNFKNILLLSIAIISIYSLYIYLLPSLGNIIGEMYMDRMESNSDSNSGGITTLILKTTLVFLPFFFYTKELSKYNFILILPVFSLLFYLLGREIAYLGRLGTPYTIFIPISLVLYLRNKYFLSICVIVISLALWYGSVILQGGYKTYPFIQDKYWNFKK